MTSTPEAEQHTRLWALLHEVPADPEAAVRVLATERASLQRNSEHCVELLDQEQRWLLRFHNTGSEQLRDDLLGVRRDWLRLRIRNLAAARPDVAILLELADAKAAARTAGEPEMVEQCEQAIGAGLTSLDGSADFATEIGERFALLTTALDDIPIEHQIELLRTSGEVFVRIAEATETSRSRRLGRRLLRAADDRELARRLERRLGRRGVAVLESTNFVLLLVVLGTLLIEATVKLNPTQQLVFQWIDALACLFFIADFVFELSLHPKRLSWFWRNALTDLVPAIPSVLFLLPTPPTGAAVDNLLVLRLLRLLRVTWAARYVQALRPLLRSVRLLLFLVRGLDGLVARFGQYLNREFVFVPAASEVRRMAAQDDLRDLLFASLHREHELATLLPRPERRQVLHERVEAAREMMDGLQASAFDRPVRAAASRDVAIGDAIEFLYSLRKRDLGRYLSKSDVQALDRVVRVMSTVPVRWLPLVSRLAVHPLPPTPEERIIELARRAADWLESWHGRLLFFADLHGIVTGPQILDRVASAMVKASQRPAVRLLLFGGLFLMFNELLKGTFFGNFLSKVVGLPLILLGSVCMIFLILGHWMKRLAGQASDSYRLTSEAHFISQLERVQSRYEQEDLDFLTTRVFADPINQAHAHHLLEEQLDSARTGVPVAGAYVPDHVRLESNRIALLYLHFLDGAPLHISDVKTTEQLLANQSLENLRNEFLAMDKRERRALRKLKLDDGSLFSGPYLWFRFITESIAVEAAKRIAGYNSFCIPTDEREHAAPAAREKMDSWLERRRDKRGGRSPKDSKEDAGDTTYPTTEFTALDFIGGDEERDRHIAGVFGDEVLEVVKFDRRTMVREIFGTRPVNHLPKEDRSFNPLRFYENRLSHGRVLLAPVMLLWRFFRTIGWVVVKVRQIVREVLDPELAMRRREVGEAPFAVALRKIHRMKAPGLLAAMHLRLRLDPIYSGAPAGWTRESDGPEDPQLERDLRFLQLREREVAKMRDDAERVRTDVAALHLAVKHLPPLYPGAERPEREQRRAGELAVTCAWISDKDDVRTLMRAERWRDEVLPEVLANGEKAGLGRRAWQAFCGYFVSHPVKAWRMRHGQGLGRETEAVLRHAYDENHRHTRHIIDAWARLAESVSPTEHAVAVLRGVYRHGTAVRRDVIALRTVQSLAVLDVRNYRDLVFRIGDYAADGEDPDLGRALP